MDHFSEYVKRKALEFIRNSPEGFTKANVSDGVYYVESPNSETPYRVKVLEQDGAASWVVCTCANGSHNGGMAKCYHAYAVLEVYYPSTFWGVGDRKPSGVTSIHIPKTRD